MTPFYLLSDGALSADEAGSDAPASEMQVVADPDDPRYGVSLADGKVGEALGPKGYYGLLFQFLASCDGSRLSWI